MPDGARGARTAQPTVVLAQPELEHLHAALEASCTQPPTTAPAKQARSQQLAAVRVVLRAATALRFHEEMQAVEVVRQMNQLMVREENMLAAGMGLSVMRNGRWRLAQLFLQLVHHIQLARSPTPSSQSCDLRGASCCVDGRSP